MKKGLKMKNYATREKFPELADLHTDQVRAKFSNLKGYFIHEYKKIQAAPSGSCGKPSSKWELFDLMSFLHDTVASQPTYSSDINEQVNPIDNPLVIEVTQNTFDEFQIGESSTGSSTQPVSPSFDLSNGSSDRSVAPATSATSSLQNQKASNSSKKRKLQNSFEEECLQTLKELGNTSTPNDLGFSVGKTVEVWIRSLLVNGQKVAAARISQVVLETEREYGLPDDKVG